MKATLCCGRFSGFAMAFALVGGIAVSAGAETVLIDFGNDASFRGATTVSPDSNGHYWNSIVPGAYIVNLVDIGNAGTGINFGFSTPVGTDSYNGPAGPTTNWPLTPAEINAADIDAAALGNLGIKAAAVDFAAEHNTRFEIQNLDPAKKYALTFYGAHEFSDDDATVYSVYTDNTYSSLVASGSLNIQTPGSPWLHNRDTVLTLSNLSPQVSNILYVQFTGANGHFGYLNSMQIVGSVPEPSTLLLVASCAGLVFGIRRRS
jgi:hypothetical protein